MSAIAWYRLPTFNGAPPCEGRCMTDAKSRGIGMWRLELLDRPAGHWCAACRKAMGQAWDSALTPEPVARRAAA